MDKFNRAHFVKQVRDIRAGFQKAKNLIENDRSVFYVAYDIDLINKMIDNLTNYLMHADSVHEEEMRFHEEEYLPRQENE